MTITEVLQKVTAGELAGWACVLLILLLSLIQISPLKLNPWDHIFGWIGKKTNGATAKRLELLEKQIRICGSITIASTSPDIRQGVPLANIRAQLR